MCHEEATYSLTSDVIVVLTGSTRRQSQPKWVSAAACPLLLTRSSYEWHYDPWRREEEIPGNIAPACWRQKVLSVSVFFVSSLCQYFCDAVYFLVSDKLTVLVNSRYLSLSISLERVTSRRHASLSIACCLVIARPKLSGCRSSLTNNRSQPALPWSSSSSSPVLGRTPNAGHSRYV